MFFDPFDYSSNHQRRLKPDTIYRIRKFIDDFSPKNEIEKRDLKILKYAFIDCLSASAIYRKCDPDLVGLGNRSKNKPLTVNSICRIISNYCRDFDMTRLTRTNRNRVNLMRRREKYPIKHIRMCAFCGAKDNLEEHHMIPLSFGGDNNDLNLVFLCKACHKEVTDYHMRIKKERRDSN